MIKEVFRNGRVHEAFLISSMYIPSDSPDRPYLFNVGGIVGDSEDDILDANRLTEIRNKMIESMLQTTLKRLSVFQIRSPSHSATLVSSNSGYKSYGVAASYGGSVRTRSPLESSENYTSLKLRIIS